MAKDFYKMEKDGMIKHRVVMGRTNYEGYENAGWTTIKPVYDPDLIISNPSKFEGMEKVEDSADEAVVPKKEKAK